MGKENDLFEDLGSSPGDEEEHHELSLILRERKERTRCRARNMLPNKFRSHNLSLPQSKPTNEFTKHRDNQAHNSKLKTVRSSKESGTIVKRSSFDTIHLPEYITHRPWP